MTAWSRGLRIGLAVTTALVVFAVAVVLGIGYLLGTWQWWRTKPAVVAAGTCAGATYRFSVEGRDDSSSLYARLRVDDPQRRVWVIRFERGVTRRPASATGRLEVQQVDGDRDDGLSRRVAFHPVGAGDPCRGWARVAGSAVWPD